MRKRNQRGQSIIEYTIGIFTLVMALVVIDINHPPCDGRGAAECLIHAVKLEYGGYSYGVSLPAPVVP